MSQSGSPVRRALVPLGLGLALALVPTPPGLSQDAWWFFALFVAVIAALITEPGPPAAIGLAGVVAAAGLGLVRDTPAAAAQWALSGFANSIVWLIFAAFMFTVGYARTGLGRRVALHLVRVMGGRTLGLGYAVTIADLVFAPVTPSATARSAGTIYPVIRHIPELYGSRPGEASSRLLGGYLLYTALAASFITSSTFITALAPNALAITIIQQTADVQVSWTEWAAGFAPVGAALLALTPLVLYWIYPPSIRAAPEVPPWAAEQLALLGPMTRREWTLLVLVLLALTLWIAGAASVDPAVTAILIVLLMVALGVVSWADVVGQSEAWNVLIWFGTLVTLAGGLTETGFVAWVAAAVGPLFAGLGLATAAILLVGIFYFLHYFFASITAHTATLLPVFLAIAISIPGLSPKAWSLLLGYSLGLMGILTFYASGQSVIYYASGYVARRHFWVLGLVMGTLFIGTHLVILPRWLAWLGY